MDINTKYPFMQNVANRIKKHEGYRLLPYSLSYDTTEGKTVVENFKTGGYGHRIQAGEEIPTTREGWEKVFQSDLNKAVGATEKLIDADKVDPVAFGVVTEMVFQMGATGVSKFKKTLGYINSGEYHKASKEMLNSNWAKQTPDRAVYLSNLIRDIDKDTTHRVYP